MGAHDRSVGSVTGSLGAPLGESGAAAARGAAGGEDLVPPRPRVIRELDALASIASDIGAVATADEGRRLAERLSRGRFYVACVGQFKRGKSSLLNALVGDAVLPTGVTPVTSVVTILQHGDSRGAVVRSRDGATQPVAIEALHEYVTERHNPANGKGVSVVEVSLPSAALGGGLCLVDTPGVGSVFGESTAATRAFLPALDGAIVVLGSDPPLSGDELDLIASLADRVDALVLVLNKADRVTESEQDEAASFAVRMISDRIGRGVPRPLRVSAVERLAGHPTREWPALEAELGALRRRAADLLQSAAVRQGRRLVDLVRRDLASQRDALTRPMEEARRRLALLHQAVAGAETAVRELGARLSVEREQLRWHFHQHRETFLARACPPARETLARRIGRLAASRSRRLYGPAIDCAAGIARTEIRAWMQEIEPEARRAYSGLMARFLDLAEQFVSDMAGSHAVDLGTLSADAIESAVLAPNRDFCFTEVRAITSPGFWASLVDTFGPRPWRSAVATRAASKYLDRLLLTNSARVANDLVERVARSQADLERDIRLRLTEAASLAERAVERAKAAREAGADSIRGALAALDAHERRVGEVAAALHGGAA